MTHGTPATPTETIILVARGRPGREATTVMASPLPPTRMGVGAVTGVGGVHVGQPRPAMAVTLAWPSPVRRGREIIRVRRHRVGRGREPLPRFLGLLGAVAGLVRLTIPGRARVAERRLPAILVLKRFVALTLAVVIGTHNGVPTRPPTRGASPVPVRREALPTPVKKLETGGR